MPNGRSGGFLIDKADLVQLLAQADRDAIVASLLVEADGAHPGFQKVTAAAALPYVQACRFDRLAVEEQDHLSYIVHVSNTHPVVWISVSHDSPLFRGLSLKHDEWARTHPNWNGWIGF